MDMKICRKCKHYRPDGRYRGVIGICKAKDIGVSVTSTCELFEKGRQRWLSGEEVKDGTKFVEGAHV